ncbi:MAG: DUF6049 family protein, partial [Kofleriaceae bacterium]
MTFWVTGGDTIPARDVRQELVQIIPDKKEYAAGNTAELLLQAPFYPAQGLVTWRRSGIVKLERIDFDGPTKVITVPIDDAMTPNMYVQVDLVGARARLDDHGDPDPKLPKRPAYAVGAINLPIPPRTRTLDVKVTPRAAKVAPGTKDAIDVVVKDAQGKPVADAEVAIFAVDESILALSGYQFPNPIDTFYGGRAPGVADTYLRSYVKLTKPDPAKLTGDLMRRAKGRGFSGPGGGGGRYRADVTTLSDDMDGEVAAAGAAMALDEGAMGKEDDRKMTEKKPAAAPSPARSEALEQARNAGVLGGLALDKNKEESQGQTPPTTPIALRTDFNPLAAFASGVKTDANGKATLDIKLPDNLTRYRLVAIAVAGAKQFGKGESSLTARLPLMVRPSPPRFLNFGDTFMLPVVVQNQTDAPMTVRVAARTANVTLTDGAGREFSVPANDRVEVQFPASAEMAGTARLQIVGAAGDASDAAELSLPVWTPATTEAFATYGVIDNGAMQQPVAL